MSSRQRILEIPMGLSTEYAGSSKSRIWVQSHLDRMGKSLTCGPERFQGLQVYKLHMTGVFTGLLACNPLTIVVQGADCISLKEWNIDSEEIVAVVTDLNSLEKIHKYVQTTSAAERARSRNQSEKDSKTHFEDGNYVVVGTTQLGVQSKIAPRSHTWVRCNPDKRDWGDVIVLDDIWVWQITWQM
jgi:hypothetical protein